MAGSLTERSREAGRDVAEITVESKKLSAYLDEPVHFLKLDIEGVEDTVLAEAAPMLHNVQYIFCEYHQSDKLPCSRLARILDILDAAGFDVHVAKSYSSHLRTGVRAMNHVSTPYALSLWAKNRNWSAKHATKVSSARKKRPARKRPRKRRTK